MDQHLVLPAGWYPDPQDPEAARWWTGASWAASIRSLGQSHASPPLSTGESELEDSIRRLRAEYDDLRNKIIETSDAMILQDVGIYEYSHPLDTADGYKVLLSQIAEGYKTSIRNGTAVASTKRWVINGSEKDGAKMVAEFSKLILRAYNNEVDNVLRTLRPYSVDAAVSRLEKLRTSIAKLGTSMKLSITDTYHSLRIQEVRLTADYLEKIAEQKEREREERVRLREEELAKREYEVEQARLEKERAHYETVVAALKARGDEGAVVAAQDRLVEIERMLEGVIQRAANIRAGYVYVISNVGAFGDRVVKIGLTRRLEPMDRIRELGDASVPFRFDVHALIFSNDAVGLENALHQEFASHRVNLVNAHREFFFVTPAAVKAVLHRLRGDLLTFVDAPEALEWHQSETTRRSLNSI